MILGQGSYGIVEKIKIGDKYYARKFFDQKKQHYNKDEVQNELDALKRLQEHPFIIKYHSHEENENGIVSITMEYAPHGTLQELLDSDKRPKDKEG